MDSLAFYFVPVYNMEEPIKVFNVYLTEEPGNFYPLQNVTLLYRADPNREEAPLRKIRGVIKISPLGNSSDKVRIDEQTIKEMLKDNRYHMMPPEELLRWAKEDLQKSGLSRYANLQRATYMKKRVK